MPRTNYCISNVNRRTDGRTDGQTDRRIDGRTEWGIAIALSQIGWFGAKNMEYLKFQFKKLHINVQRRNDLGEFRSVVGNLLPA